MKKVLIIDSNIYMGNMLMAFFKEKNYITYFAYSIDTALIFVSSVKADMIIIDPNFNDLGESVLKIAEHKSNRVVLMFETQKLSMEYEHREYIIKPFAIVQLTDLLRKRY